MSNEHAFPPAVVLGLWLNAARSGSVSPTDAANALESLTHQIDLTTDAVDSSTNITTWLGLVELVKSANQPVAIALPIDGDPAGIPSSVLALLLRESGVVAIDSDLLLLQQSDEFWRLQTAHHKVIHYDLSQTRRNLTDHLALATKQLSASDLIGDESEILEALESFRSLHLPPSLTKRSVDTLELASRVMIIASGAIKSTTALHSPSIDRQRVQVLQSLITESRAVLQSVGTFLRSYPSE
jgi:hypothetical protein